MVAMRSDDPVLGSVLLCVRVGGAPAPPLQIGPVAGRDRLTFVHDLAENCAEETRRHLLHRVRFVSSSRNLSTLLCAPVSVFHKGELLRCR